MYSIQYSDNFFIHLEEFIISYSSIFEKLYNDTGIEDEYIIVENYRKISRQFKEKLLNSIQEQMLQETIL